MFSGPAAIIQRDTTGSSASGSSVSATARIAIICGVPAAIQLIGGRNKLSLVVMSEQAFLRLQTNMGTHMTSTVIGQDDSRVPGIAARNALKTKPGAGTK